MTPGQPAVLEEAARRVEADEPAYRVTVNAGRQCLRAERRDGSTVPPLEADREDGLREMIAGQKRRLARARRDDAMLRRLRAEAAAG